MKLLRVRKEDSVEFKALIMDFGYSVVSHHILSSCCRNKIRKMYDEQLQFRSKCSDLSERSSGY